MATQIEYENRLTLHCLDMASPAWQIIHGARVPWGDEAHPVEIRVAQIMHNFFEYGTGAAVAPGPWIWQPNAPGIEDGKPLVAGNINATNCGGYARAFCWLMNHIMMIGTTKNKYAQAVACAACDAALAAENSARVDYVELAPKSTLASRIFLTNPGTTSIDSGWVGSTRSHATNYPGLQCFKFTGHTYSRF